MKLRNTIKHLTVLHADGMKKVYGGYYYEDGQPLGEIKGDPPPRS